MSPVKQTTEAVDELQLRLLAEQATIEQIRSALIEDCRRYQFSELIASIEQPLVNPELRKDSFDGQQSLFAEWRTPSGALLGYILIHGGGQVYGEFDVLKPHPTKPKWVIEALTVWGQADAIKTDPKLLPALES